VQPGTEHIPQGCQVLWRRDTPEENHDVRLIQLPGQASRVAPKRFRVATVLEVNRHPRDLAQLRDVDMLRRRSQSASRHDHLDAVPALRRAGERGCVGQLAAKVQCAHEREDFADRGSGTGPQSLSER
jgi:hypothetical protein